MLKRIRQIEYQIQMIWCKLKNNVSGGIQSIVAGTNVTIDNTDPLNPVVSATGGGSGGGVQSVQSGSNNVEGSEATSTFASGSIDTVDNTTTFISVSNNKTMYYRDNIGGM